MDDTASFTWTQDSRQDQTEEATSVEADVGQLPNFSPYQQQHSNQATKLISRSSLSYRSLTSPNLSAASAFTANLDKVHDVLPHVDRDTLALYLKKANGDDMRAIGDYLNDERNDTIMGQ